MIFYSALIFCLTALVAVGFQSALALGAPWGHLTMAGKFPGRLPALMRYAALLQAIMLLLACGLVLAHAGLAPPVWATASSTMIWVVVAMSAVSLLLNLITPARAERHLWAPLATVMLISSLLVATAG